MWLRTSPSRPSRTAAGTSTTAAPATRVPRGASNETRWPSAASPSIRATTTRCVPPYPRTGRGWCDARAMCRLTVLGGPALGECTVRDERLIHADVLGRHLEMREPPLGVRAAGRGIARPDCLRCRKHLVECCTDRADRGRQNFRQGAAPGSEYGSAREQRLDCRQAEWLVPLRRHPEAARAREQRSLPLAADLADVLDDTREAGPPATRDDQSSAGSLRRFDRPVIAAIAVQLAEEQVPLLLAVAEDVFLGVESIVDERIAAVAPGVVARKKNRMGRQRRSRLPVAV